MADTAIVATHQTDPMDPMFNGDTLTPGCWMQKQATWYGPDFFPDVKANPGSKSKYTIGADGDIGIFYFPPIDPAHGSPALGAGDTLMVIAPPDGSEPKDEVKAVAQFLSTPQGTQRWIEAGSAISANTTTPAAWYEGFYKLKVAADILSNAIRIRLRCLRPHATGCWCWCRVDRADRLDPEQRIDSDRYGAPEHRRRLANHLAV